MAAEAFGAEVLKVYNLLKPHKKEYVNLNQFGKKIKIDQVSVDEDYHDEKQRLTKAKIIPFKKNNEEIVEEADTPEQRLAQPDEQEEVKPVMVDEVSSAKKEVLKQNFSASSSSKSNNKLGSVGIKSAEEERLIREEEERKRLRETPSTSVFLLEEKERSKGSQKKLKEKEVFQSYKNSLKVQINKSGNKKSVTSKTGVLVSKNQK